MYLKKIKNPDSNKAGPGSFTSALAVFVWRKDSCARKLGFDFSIKSALKKLYGRSIIYVSRYRNAIFCCNETISDGFRSLEAAAFHGKPLEKLRHRQALAAWLLQLGQAQRIFAARDNDAVLGRGGHHLSGRLARRA